MTSLTADEQEELRKMAEDVFLGGDPSHGHAEAIFAALVRRRFGDLEYQLDYAGRVLNVRLDPSPEVIDIAITKVSP